MIALFSVDRLNASPAVFDREKLSWVNAQYLSSLPLAELLPHLEPFLAEVGLVSGSGDQPGPAGGGAREAHSARPDGRVQPDPARLAAAIELHRGRVRTLRELAAVIAPYFRERLDYPPDAIARFAADPELPAHLAALRDRLAALPAFTKEAIEAELRSVASERKLKAGTLIHPTRAALSGAQAGPPLFDLVEVMGREATLRHLDNFIASLSKAQAGAVPAAEETPAEALPARPGPGR
jgi:glutamyl/glutaminyl-tRNA synthetase